MANHLLPVLIAILVTTTMAFAGRALPPASTAQFLEPPPFSAHVEPPPMLAPPAYVHEPPSAATAILPPPLQASAAAYVTKNGLVCGVIGFLTACFLYSLLIVIIKRSLNARAPTATDTQPQDEDPVLNVARWCLGCFFTLPLCA